VVVPVNPDLVARCRGPAPKKDHAEDARIAWLLALDRHTSLRPLIPHGHQAAALRAIARDDERAARDQRRLGNRLRQDRIWSFPTALAIAGHDLGAPTMLGLLERWPTRDQLASASHHQLVAFARAGRHGWPDRFAQALAADPLTPRAWLVRAKADTIWLAATQLLAIGSHRHLGEHRMAELLGGAPGQGRTRQPQEDNPGQALPGGTVYRSFPGLGDRLAARVAGEIGDHIDQDQSPNPLAWYAGKAPVTRRSGKSELVVATRLACDRYPADAVQQWALCSLRRSGWAREFYDAQRARGTTHHAALRALGNRWLEILWHCLMRGQPSDEATHTANRNRALGKAA
jgi:Transposase IS116/IS110/IS902 family